MTQLHATGAQSKSNELSDDQFKVRVEAMAATDPLSKDNVTLEVSDIAGLSNGLMGAGALGLAATLAGAFIMNGRHAMAAFEVGVFAALAISLGSLFYVMVFHSLNAGWSITIRRQFENLAKLIWVPISFMAVIVAVEVASGGQMLTWLDSSKESVLLEHKQPFLNPVFFVIRFLVYAALWLFLTRKLARLSLEMDDTGDRTLMRRARYMSGWGLLVFALTTAFAAFDFLMGPDYRFFSTMWGVYYFATSALGSMAACILITTLLRKKGKLQGLVTEEHYHDMGKLLFAFTVFWSYIAFSQYFLIWYANVPEETAWFLARKAGGWHNAFIGLCLLHFVVPFIILINRGVKRSMLRLSLMAMFMLGTVVFDLVFILRPLVYVNELKSSDPGAMGWWLDIAGVVGVLGVFFGLALRQACKSPLVPMKDPMLHEAIKHKNYV